MKVKKDLVLVFVAAAVALGITGLTFVGQHRRSRTVAAAVATTEFSRLRARFAGAPPLVDMVQRHSAVEPRGGVAVRTIHEIHTLVFDTRGGDRLVEVSAPYEFDPEPIDLSLDQMARRGPGPLVDFRHPSGGQFFSWTE